jgi:hypothetical protein
MALLFFYCCFSYLFVTGVNTVEKLPLGYILFAPIIFPMMLGVAIKKSLELLGEISDKL